MSSADRVDWVDYAKGISIVLVVMMHSTLSSEDALGHTGWLHEVVEFARPFRIPAFFLIAGLFVARTIEGEWRSFLDRKILHFVYFYVLWLTIQFAFKAPGLIAAQGAGGALRLYAMAFVEPFGTLWFIYLLPVFYAATRLTRALPPLLVLALGAILEIAPVETGWTSIDEFAARFVYFYAGYLAGPWIVQRAGLVGRHASLAGIALAGWALVNLWCVKAGLAGLPLLSLGLGLAGAAAVIAASVLLAQAQALTAIRLCGEQSLVIYLAFFLPMAASRTAFVKTGVIADPTLVAATVTLLAVALPLLLYRLLRHTRLNVLFERPPALRLVRPLKLQPAQ